MSPLAIVSAIALFAGQAIAGDFDAATPVQVALPAGWSATTSSVQPLSDPKMKLVVINMLNVRNKSRTVPLDVRYSSFSLVADGDSYKVSPQTKKLRFSLAETSLGPGQSESGSLAFEVPAGVVRAALLFDAEQFGITYPTSY
jgi:hypothetical protein